MSLSLRIRISIRIEESKDIRRHIVINERRSFQGRPNKRENNKKYWKVYFNFVDEKINQKVNQKNILKCSNDFNIFCIV